MRFPDRPVSAFRSIARRFLAGAGLLPIFTPALFGGAPLPQSGQLVISPAHGWVLPLFTPDGYRSMTLRGDDVTEPTRDRIDVVDLNVTLFSGDAALRITTIVLSPQASYFPSKNVASGPSSVRIIRTADNSEATGEDWTYDFGHESVFLRRNVHVIFQQPLNDFLK